MRPQSCRKARPCAVGMARGTDAEPQEVPLKPVGTFQKFGAVPIKGFLLSDNILRTVARLQENLPSDTLSKVKISHYSRGNMMFITTQKGVGAAADRRWGFEANEALDR